MEGLKAGTNIELELTLRDIRAQAHLGLYNAHKFLAVMHSLSGKNDAAIQAMGMAYWHWRDYTSLMAEMHHPVSMQRNISFSSWQTYDEAVLRDYQQLGGSGIPPRPAERR